jgi:phosphoribosylformylglycinamidine cyclo-ligase
MAETYEAAGVSIAAGEAAVERIKPHVRSTYRSGVLSDIGGFGGLFDLSGLGYEHPVLVSTTDGVGTKAVVAHRAQRYDTIGIDLVAMCVDDLVCQGAEPLFFLDYVSIGQLDGDQMEQLVSGVAEGCRIAGCALIGGEMAEHPGVMNPGEFDLVGFAVGAVERSRIITGDTVAPGDVVIGLPSPNLRSNGFSLARRLYFDVAARSIDDPAWDGADHSVADELLSPSVIYTPAVRALIDEVEVRAVAHITGGGLPGNLARVLADDVDARVDRSSWESPRVFRELQRIGDVDDREMLRVFNMGIGMVVVLPADEAHRAISLLGEHGHRAVVMGEIVAGSGAVTLT